MTHSNAKTYTTKELSNLAGVSPRTLRYYDQIGLLVPSRAQNGYRAYRSSDVKRLRHILLLRSCNVSLESIKIALDKPDFDLPSMLQEHLASLCRQREELNRTIAATRIAAAELEALEIMNDTQMFEQIKKQSIISFEEEYGAEARQRYGDKTIDETNRRMLAMDKTAWDAKEELEQRIKDSLIVAMATGDPSSPESQLTAEMHAQWIKAHWGKDAYSPDAHVSLVESYLEDPRFVEYYDGACGAKATEFLRDVIKANVF